MFLLKQSGVWLGLAALSLIGWQQIQIQRLDGAKYSTDKLHGMISKLESQGIEDRAQVVFLRSESEEEIKQLEARCEELEAGMSNVIYDLSGIRVQQKAVASDLAGIGERLPVVEKRSIFSSEEVMEMQSERRLKEVERQVLENERRILEAKALESFR